MKTETIEATMIELEHQMWEAFSTGDSAGFGALVAPDALMVVGGSRMPGHAYAQMIGQVRLVSYTLNDFTVKALADTVVLVHYTVAVQDFPGPMDISGTYYVTDVWVQRDGCWQVVFDQDSKPMRE